MRLLFVLTHPVPESLTAALCRAAVDTAQAKGHEVRLMDLHAEGFNPVMSAEERRQHYSGILPADVVPHVEALQWAEGLILVYPTWWNAQPALLKGWFDRAGSPGLPLSRPHPHSRCAPR